ncbi:hypothetical protein M2146_002657 [Lachnospiraceae bacterium PF1-22]|uniref:GNAT family N-acetyltransferase n=1 Tax=Ohessyouella blattaphilus TaxID=2949333 RepID=UPI003E2E7F46
MEQIINMAIYQVTDKKTIAPLYAGWEETMIWSCLDDCMGVAYADDLEKPVSAQIIIGPYSFLAGEVNYDLIKNNFDYSFDMIPQNPQWEKAIVETYGEKVEKRMRYATKKDKEAFDTAKLQEIVSSLAEPYTLKAIDQSLFCEIMTIDWARDLCANYGDSERFLKDGLGFVALKEGEIVAGASSFTYYSEGIEIEIDTRVDERRRGLALACGAKLILECLSRELYPSWDAYNKESLALSAKLGYRFYKEYPTYEFQ